MLTRDRAADLAERVRALSGADEVGLWISGGDETHLRFARNAPSTSGRSTNYELTVRSSFGTRTASATVNQLDDASLADVVRRSEALARLAPDDPEFVPALGPQPYPEIDAFDDETAERAAELLARGVAHCIGEARRQGVQAAGFARAGAQVQCIASSRGLFGYHRSTGAYLAETARTSDGSGSGWASASSLRAAEIDFRALSSTAIRKALASREPRPLEPGVYPAILEPACVANLVSQLLWRMSARDADEGRSYFSAPGGNRIGERLFPAVLDLYSDPAHPRAPGLPWSPEEGLPQKRRDWIRSGRLENLVYGRFWAGRQGVDPVPFPSNLILAGGRGGVEDLVRSTRRGLLVTSLWYIRDLDPRTLLLTGLTRDGVFWIEDGEVAYPVTNFRWNDSPVALLRSAEALSDAVQVPPRPSYATNVVVPAIRVGEFHLASVSDAV